VVVQVHAGLAPHAVPEGRHAQPQVPVHHTQHLIGNPRIEGKGLSARQAAG
jgi:hypothetical protein